MLTINPIRLGNIYNKKPTGQEKSQTPIGNFLLSSDTVSFSAGLVRKGFFNQIVPSEAYIAAKKMTLSISKRLKDGSTAELGYLKGKKEYEVIDKGLYSINNEYAKSGKLIQKHTSQYTDTSQQVLFKRESVDYVGNTTTTTIFGPGEKIREQTYKTPDFTEFRVHDTNGNLIKFEITYKTPEGCNVKEVYNPSSTEHELVEEFQYDIDGSEAHLLYKNDVAYKIKVSKQASDGNKVTIEDDFVNKKNKKELSQRTVTYADGESQIYTFKPGGENIASAARVIKLPDGTVCREEKYYGSGITADYGLVYLDDQLAYKTKYNYKDKLVQATDNDGYLVPLEEFNIFLEESYKDVNKLKDWQNFDNAEKFFNFKLQGILS